MDTAKIGGMVALVVCVGLLAVSLNHLANNPYEEQKRAAFLYKYGSTMVIVALIVVILYFMFL